MACAAAAEEARVLCERESAARTPLARREEDMAELCFAFFSFHPGGERMGNYLKEETNNAAPLPHFFQESAPPVALLFSSAPLSRRPL